MYMLMVLYLSTTRLCVHSCLHCNTGHTDEWHSVIQSRLHRWMTFSYTISPTPMNDIQLYNLAHTDECHSVIQSRSHRWMTFSYTISLIPMNDIQLYNLAHTDAWHSVMQSRSTAFYTPPEFCHTLSLWCSSKENLCWSTICCFMSKEHCGDKDSLNFDSLVPLLTDISKVVTQWKVEGTPD